VGDSGGKFATDVVDTGGKYPIGVFDTGGAPGLANISSKFWKNFNDPYVIFRGLGDDDS
jgi:hypothetical protein